MNIIFQNKGVLSLLDLTTMGDSSKREDSSKIGKFDSGLKYALSILYRNGIKVEIYSGNSKYTFSSKVISDEITSKAKELLVINEERKITVDPEENCKQCKDLYFDGSVNTGPHNLCEGRYCQEFETSSIEIFEHITAFSPQLGHEWKVWMAIRELYSNCLDEGGEVIFDDDVEIRSYTGDTIIKVFDNGTLQEIINNWNNYFLSEEIPLYEKYGVKIYKNNEKFLRLYKNKILIFEDRNVKSKYIYDYLDASIDEMRMLNKKENFVSQIVSCISYCNDETFIQDYISHSEKDYFESNFNYYSTLSDTWVKVVNQTYKKFIEVGDVFVVFSELYHNIIEDSRFDVGVKKISYNSPSYNWNKAKVEIISNPYKIDTEEDNFQTKVLKICSKFNFQIKHPIIESKISGFTCISDVNKKVLYVSKDFSEDTMWEMIKAHFRIDSNDDADYCFKQYVEQIKIN